MFSVPGGTIGSGATSASVSVSMTPSSESVRFAPSEDPVTTTSWETGKVPAGAAGEYAKTSKTGAHVVHAAVRGVESARPTVRSEAPAGANASRWAGLDGFLLFIDTRGTSGTRPHKGSSVVIRMATKRAGFAGRNPVEYAVVRSLDRCPGRRHKVAERLHQLLRDLPRPAIPDHAPVELDDGPDLRGSARDERLVRGPHVEQCEGPLDGPDPELLRELEDGLPRDPGEVRGRVWGHHRVVLDDEEVVRARLGNVPLDIQEERLVRPVLVRLDPGEDLVQVVQGLDARAQALRRDAAGARGDDLQPLLVLVLRIQHDPGLRDDHDRGSALALPRIEPQVPGAAGDDRPDVAVHDVVPPARLQDEVRELLGGVGDLEVDRLRGLEHPDRKSVV